MVLEFPGHFSHRSSKEKCSQTRILTLIIIRTYIWATHTRIHNLTLVHARTVIGNEGFYHAVNSFHHMKRTPILLMLSPHSVTRKLTIIYLEIFIPYLHTHPLSRVYDKCLVWKIDCREQASYRCSPSIPSVCLSIHPSVLHLYLLSSSICIVHSSHLCSGYNRVYASSSTGSFPYTFVSIYI